MRRPSVKTTALKKLRDAFHVNENALEVNSKDVLQFKQVGNAAQSRRKFIGNVSKAAAAAGLAGLYESCNTANKKTQPTIAVIGAGMAGLHAAYILKQAGFTSTVYEASQRHGGRIFTVPEMMGPGLWTEMGGEFIDTGHKDMLNLAKHFSLPLIDRSEPSEKALHEFCFYFGGKHYTNDEFIKAMQPYAAQMKADINSLSDEIDYENHSAADTKFDNMSIMDYADSLGIKGWFRDFILNSYTSEYGMDASEQSALSFMLLFDTGDNGKNYRIYGESDEIYSVQGGNYKLCDALAKELTGQIQFDHSLAAINQNNAKEYVMSFKKTGGATTDITADIVLITIPFTLLREVDIKTPLPAWKMNGIKNLGYGMNSKIFIGTNERVWRKQGYTGYCFADNAVMSGYDHTQMQGGNTGAGGFTLAPGGKRSMALENMSTDDMQKEYVSALDAVYPGVKDSFNGRLQKWFWPGYTFAKCSYVSYRVGQYSTIGGTEIKPVDNIYFAGEHCSYEFQGFMNGAAETGRQAAEAIIKKIKEPVAK